MKTQKADPVSTRRKPQIDGRSTEGESGSGVVVRQQDAFLWEAIQKMALRI